MPDSQQRRRPKGETDSDDDEEWPRSDSESDKMERVRRQLKEALREIKLPPFWAAVVLASVEIPGPKRRQFPYGGNAAVAPPKTKTRKRNGDDGKTAAASKPVLVLGR